MQDKRQQANKYDKVFRENMEAALPVILSLLIGIRAKDSEVLADDLQHTKERKADVLRKITDQQGNCFILHIEYQAANEPQMALRMAEYCIMALRKYRLPVQQHVIFLGKGNAAMPTAIQEENLQFRYNLISLKDVDYKLFLKSSRPEQKILAVLGNFDNDAPEHALRHIVQEVRQSASGLELGRYFQQLRILAQLRNLDLNFNDAMGDTASYFSDDKDIMYILGRRKGQEEGREKGLKKGQMQSKEIFVRNLLHDTDFTIEKIARLADVSVGFVRKLRAAKQ